MQKFNRQTGLMYNDASPQKIVPKEEVKNSGDSFSLTGQDYKNLISSFETFINQDIDPLWDNYQLSSRNVVVRVFTFNPTDFDENKADIQLGNVTSSELKLLTFPIAIVFKSGAEAYYYDDEGTKHRYQTGDFVKMKDKDARIVSNPDYEAWVDNAMANSNAKKVGTAPPDRIANLRRNFSKNSIKANPFDFRMTRDDLFTFNLDLVHIDGRVKDVRKFLEI